MKHNHEFRDPVHTFISVRTEERKVIDSRPFQRLRNIHQLALTYLVYPGATHKRFEHSLGVMELASRIFDVVMKPENIHHNSVREIIPDAQGLSYWKSVLRMAALCHDVGHLPFYRMRPPRPVARRQRRLGQRAYRAAIAEEGEPSNWIQAHLHRKQGDADYWLSRRDYGDGVDGAPNGISVPRWSLVTNPSERKPSMGSIAFAQSPGIVARPSRRVLNQSLI